MLPLPSDDALVHANASLSPDSGTSGGSSQSASAPPHMFLDRDHSILAFNERVFDWAVRPDVPLLERLRYLCIVSSNLDEFFEVRAAPHITAAQKGETKGLYSTASFEAMAAKIHSLVERQYALYNESLVPAFAAHGIRIVGYGERSPAQKRWVHDYFVNEVRPLLIPVGLDPAHPFPQVANKSLNFIVRLKGHDAFGRENEIAIVKVPRALPRLIRMPARVAPGEALFVSLSSIVRAHLEDLFPGREVTEFSQFRVTRHSDLALDEEDVRNLRTALRQGLQHRHYGQAVRLEVSSGCSQFLSDFLLAQFALPAAALYRVHGPVNLVRLAPGAWSSQRHWHSHEDEFVFILEGEVVLIEDGGETVLRGGDCAAFPKNSGNGHHMINRSGKDAVYLEVGSRHPDDMTTCADIDLKSANADGVWRHKDGTPYPTSRIA